MLPATKASVFQGGTLLAAARRVATAPERRILPAAWHCPLPYVNRTVAGALQRRRRFVVDTRGTTANAASGPPRRPAGGRPAGPPRPGRPLPAPPPPDPAAAPPARTAALTRRPAPRATMPLPRPGHMPPAPQRRRLCPRALHCPHLGAYGELEDAGIAPVRKQAPAAGGPPGRTTVSSKPITGRRSAALQRKVFAVRRVHEHADRGAARRRGSRSVTCRLGAWNCRTGGIFMQPATAGAGACRSGRRAATIAGGT